MFFCVYCAIRTLHMTSIIYTEILIVGCFFLNRMWLTHVSHCQKDLTIARRNVLRMVMLIGDI